MKYEVITIQANKFDLVLVLVLTIDWISKFMSFYVFSFVCNISELPWVSWMFNFARINIKLSGKDLMEYDQYQYNEIALNIDN